MDPRYPIGKFELPKEVTPALRQTAIEETADPCIRASESAQWISS